MRTLSRFWERSAWARALTVLAFTTVAAVGCGFFDTREPTQPVELPDGLIQLPSTTPQNVVANYSNAIQFGLVGINQFEETLGENFILTFDLADSTELFIGSIDVEQTVEAFRLAATAESDSFHFTFEEQEPEEIGNTAFYDDIPYEFRILTRISPDSAEARETYSGNADIRLETNDFGEWVIRSWDDFNDARPTVSWGRYLGERVASAPGGDGRLN